MFSISKRILVSIAERLPNDIYEEILVRLDVENLLRCKGVCKSWKSLISHPRFINAHWKRRCNNNDNGQAFFPIYTRRKDLKYYIVGSARGLVCINSFSGNEIIVANPWTREERVFRMPRLTEFSCWGFGYDPLTDDYKVVLGIEDNEKDQISFQVLSLKSNVWKNIGHVNRFYITQRGGSLCNESLHWLMYPQYHFEKSSIISLDLSKEVFKEIPPPDDADYKHARYKLLGVQDECLCIYHNGHPMRYNVWVMKKYNVGQSWVRLVHNCQVKFEFTHYNDNAASYEKSTHNMWFSQKCVSIPTTTIMQSLISPNLRAGNE